MAIYMISGSGIKTVRYAHNAVTGCYRTNVKTRRAQRRVEIADSQGRWTAPRWVDELLLFSNDATARRIWRNAKVSRFAGSVTICEIACRLMEM